MIELQFDSIDREPFVQAFNCYWQVCENPTQLSVYLHLISYCWRDKDECFPTIKRIAALCKISPRTAVSTIDRLCKIGLIEKKRVGGKNCVTRNVYRVKTLMNPDFQAQFLQESKTQEKESKSAKFSTSGNASKKRSAKSAQCELQNLHFVPNYRKEDQRKEDQTIPGSVEERSNFPLSDSPALADAEQASEEKEVEVLDEENTKAKTPLKTPQRASLSTSKTTPSVKTSKAPSNALREPKKGKSDGSKVWDAYEDAYKLRYGTEPIRNAKTNSHCKKLVEYVGRERAEVLVRFFVSHNDSFYCRQAHDLGLCVQAAQKLNTELETGKRIFRRDTDSLENIQRLSDMAKRHSHIPHEHSTLTSSESPKELEGEVDVMRMSDDDIVF